MSYRLILIFMYLGKIPTTLAVKQNIPPRKCLQSATSALRRQAAIKTQCMRNKLQHEIEKLNLVLVNYRTAERDYADEVNKLVSKWQEAFANYQSAPITLTNFLDILLSSRLHLQIYELANSLAHRNKLYNSCIKADFLDNSEQLEAQTNNFIDDEILPALIQVRSWVLSLPKEHAALRVSKASKSSKGFKVFKLQLLHLKRKIKQIQGYYSKLTNCSAEVIKINTNLEMTMQLQKWITIFIASHWTQQPEEVGKIDPRDMQRILTRIRDGIEERFPLTYIEQRLNNRKIIRLTDEYTYLQAKSFQN